MTAISRRRLVQAGSAATLTALAGFPAIGRAQTAIALRFSSSMTADDNAAHYVWYQRFQTNLKAGVGEAIKIDYFPNNQLGKESDVVQQVKVGSIDMMVTGSSIWATVLPEIGMLDLGYLFDSYAHVAARHRGPRPGSALADMLQKRAGCVILTWASHFGPRSVYTKQPVHSLADIKGVKLRVLPTPAFIETFKIMGAIPTPIPIGELYMAAQTGVVDGFEHDAATVLASKFDEVVKYCWLTEHLFSPMVVVIGKRGLDRIPANLQPGVHEGGRRLDDAAARHRQRKGRRRARRAEAKGHGLLADGRRRPRRGAEGNGGAPVGRLRQAIPGDRAAVHGDQQRQRLNRDAALGRLFKVVEAVLAMLLLAMVLMVFGNVVLRYAFNSGIVVSEELARFCFVWLTFIGAIVAVRDNAHLGMDNVVARLPRRGKLACLAASQLLILTCCVVLFWGTWRQHEINASTTAPVTGMSMIWIFGLGYLCSVCIALHALDTLRRIATGAIADDELLQVRESEEEIGNAT